jgi:glycosyltransferase involved in cell wall biosynthesis
MTSLTVVIPSLNDADLLAVCLRALTEQTRPADEIIVVDNGSTDNTTEVAHAAGARVVLEPARGVLSATAAGFDAATGDIIARLDADSIPPADWLERVEAILANAGELSSVTGPGDFYGANRVVSWLGRNLYIGGYFWSMTPLLGHAPLFGSNCALHAAVWKRVGPTVHRGLSTMHDDFDISYQLQPGMTVVYDKTLRVAISARPFESWSTLGRRLAWTYRTFSVDFRDKPPLARLRERRRWERAQTAAAQTAPAQTAADSAAPAQTAAGSAVATAADPEPDSDPDGDPLTA